MEPELNGQVADGSSVNNVQPDADTKGIDIQSELDKTKVELENKFKAEIAGLNRKNTELQNELKQKALIGKTDEEQKALLLKEKEQIQKEIEELNRGRSVDKILNSVGLPLEFSGRISGKTEDEIIADVNLLNEYLSKTAQAMADKIINERLAGKKPEAGISPDVKEISLKDFQNLSAKERASYMAKGGKITAQ